MAFLNERIYESNVPIQYVFEKGTANNEFLVVVFSGFNSADQPLQKTYNYIRTLTEINTNKLFILDSYGPRGCYYLGEKLNGKVESSVQSLITHIARLNNIKQENIICAGSSKGGSAALYYGVKYNYGHVISGAPQTKIADYVTRVCPETTKYMLGKNYTDEMKNRLNQCIFKLFNNPVMTKINIFTSENDWQYKPHILPLADIVNKKNISCNIVIENQMTCHGDIAIFFPEYLKTTVTEIITKPYNKNHKKIKSKKSIMDNKINAITKQASGIIIGIKNKLKK